MELLSSIRERRSVRAFLNTPVSDTIIQKILDTARWAPSGVNTQPWKVAVLGQKTRATLSEQILHAREASIPEDPDYHYYPTEWREPYKSRRKACGLALYGSLKIAIDETEKRKIQWYKNYIFFGAPAALMILIDKDLTTGAWLDLGMFIQNIMLAAKGYGLETCPQASLAEYPNIVRKVLSLSDQHFVVCGMAVGYADWSHPVNQYRTTREPVENFTQWYE